MLAVWEVLPVVSCVLNNNEAVYRLSFSCKRITSDEAISMCKEILRFTTEDYKENYLNQCAELLSLYPSVVA